MTARVQGRMIRSVGLVLAVVVVVATLPLAAGPARAQTGAPAVSRTAVPTGADFATTAYGDAWDFAQATDVRLTPNQTVNAAGARVEAGELRWSVREGAALLTFVFPGFGGALPLERDGAAIPIDADRYTHVSARIWSPRAVAMAFSYDRCLAPEGSDAFCRASTGNVVLEPGWNTVVQDLRVLSAGRQHVWAGRVYAFRLQIGRGEGYRLAGLQLQTAPETVEVTWDTALGSQLVWDRDADPSNNGSADPGWGVAGSGGRVQVPLGAFEPGTYRFAARNPGGGLSAYSAPVRVVPRPAPIVLDPDLAGGEDFATAHLGDPWDLTSASDVIARGNWTGTFGPSGLTAENAANDPALPRRNDPYLYLRLHPSSTTGRLDPARYHRLTVRTTYEGPFSLANAPGGGTHGRLLWTHAGRDQDRVIEGNKLIESRELVHYPGQSSFTVDLKTPPDPRLLMETSRPARDGWAAGHPITHLRYDPNEDPGPRRWRLSGVELRATDEARGGGFDIRWRDAAATQPVTVDLHYRPEAGGDWRLIAAGVPQVAGENTYRWSTAGVPSGRYLVRVNGRDGLSTGSGISTGPVDVRATIRLAGRDRVSTAVALSRAAFPDGAPAAVVARSAQFPDALAAAPLAAAAGGPLLLNATDRLEDGVRAELRRLGVATVYLMGGEAAQSPAVASQLRGLGITVVRVAGTDRFRTAAAAAETAADLWRAAGHADAGTRAVVALGEDFPDALAAGPLAGHDRRVLLLTGRGAAPSATVEALESLGAREVTVVGGPAAVSANAERGLRGSGRTVTRLAGSTRHETAELAARAAAAAGADPRVVIVASGRQFPDALAAGPAVQALGGVLLLTERDALPGVTGAWVARHKPLRLLRVAGGAAAVSDPVEARLRELGR